MPTIKIKGMSCQHCVSSVSKALADIEGIVDVTVDLEAGTWYNTIGASELMSVWTDPEFNPDEKAFYYARVMEIPTPRWVVYDKVRMGSEIPEGAELIGQERAYTSPIWYTPDN